MPQKNGYYLSMEQSKAFRLTLLFLTISQFIFAQNLLVGKVLDAKTNNPIPNVEIYNNSVGKTVYSDNLGGFSIALLDMDQNIVVIKLGYEIQEMTVNASSNQPLTILLAPLAESLSEVVIDQQQKKIFGIKNLKEVEGTAIYAGKKTEVVLVEQQIANKASGNARQAYSQVAGLNIYENDDAGLQLNIGGRGLDPNRTANFNTRQNGYDISADVLGYPESYYTPPLEALEEIQIIRGAASLQYGTQFGGLINFKLKSPNSTKELEWVSRIGGGSFGLLNVFNSFSGTKDKFSYYTFHQFKKADGFRPNSEFESQNLYANIGYQATDNTKITFESTYLRYLAKQAGGLTDRQFDLDPLFSNRNRNFFLVDWILLNAKIEHEFSAKTRASVNLFSLSAQRNALGFRVRRASVEDDLAQPRELIIDEFTNWGAEAKVVSEYSLFNKKSIFLVGAKYYQSKNKSQQGIGSLSNQPDFVFRNSEFTESALPESTFDFPNLNLAVFGEHIFRFSDNFTVTPGFRFEYIKTEADGFFINKPLQANGIVDVDGITETPEERKNERTILLLGLGASFKPSLAFEAFANISQNYRSVTFNDIRIVSPNIIVDEDISDSDGYTFDMGVRGTVKDIFRYDASVFALIYNNRIGLTRQLPEFDFRRIRGNLADATLFGIESLVTVNFSNWFFANKNFHWQHFLNTSFIESEYTRSTLETSSSRVGNEVEFVPKVNLKTGIELGYKNFKSSVQYTFVDRQFTDADNITLADRFAGDGTIGEIPAYSVMDFSAEYSYKNCKLEAGVNNLLNASYFTRRATGYPGPGIIPSAPRNFYAVLQFKF